MKTANCTIGLILALLCAAPAPGQTPAGTAFTYQGQLEKAGAPLSDTADFQFSLWDAAALGTQIGATQTAANVSVQGGLFTVWLDFGAAAFAGDARWLEIAVRSPAGSGSYTTLSPRQELTPSPYALYAQSGSATALQGRPVSSAAPGAGQVLEWNGSAWAPAADNDTTYTAGTGLTLAGTQFSLDLTYADNRYVNEGQAAGGDLTGTYPSPAIANNAVNSAKIVDGGVALADLAPNSVDSGKIVDGGVALADLASNSVNSAKIVDGSVAMVDLAANSVDSAKIVDGGVALADLSTGSVNSAKIVDGSIALADLASNSVDSSKIVDGSVALADLASNSVDSSKIVDGGVALADLASNSVNSAKIVDASVAFADLADPLVLGTAWWDWDMTSGQLDIDVTSGYPAVNIESTCTVYGDCLALRSSAAAGASTWVLYAYTKNGDCGYFSKSVDDNAYAVYIASPAGDSEGLYVYGNTLATGTKSAAIETSQGPQAIFSVESPEVEIYATGSAVLSAGAAFVAFDPLFTEAVSPNVEIRVTVTPIGGWSGLYVESTSPEGFAVASAAGEPNIRFHWMACGRRAGYDARPYIAIPDPIEEEAIWQAKEAAHAAKKAAGEEATRRAAGNAR